MQCPHCEQPITAFNRLYIWPFVPVTCPNCQGRAKLASQPWLTLLSFLLGMFLIFPIYWLSSAWVLICLAIIITVDYQVDKHFRYLQALPQK